MERELKSLIEKAQGLAAQWRYDEAARVYEKAAEIALYSGEKQQEKFLLALARQMRKAQPTLKNDLYPHDIVAENNTKREEHQAQEIPPEQKRNTMIEMRAIQMEQDLTILIEKADTLKIQGKYEEAANCYESAAELCQYRGERHRKQIYLAEAKKLRGELHKRLQFTRSQTVIEEANTQREEQIRSTILELGTKFPRLRIAEIAEKCDLPDEEEAVDTLLDMIESKEIAADYFESTETVVFDQEVNFQLKDMPAAEREKVLATWGEEHKKSLNTPAITPASTKVMPSMLSSNQTVAEMEPAGSYVQIKRQFEYIGGKVRLKINVTNTSSQGLLRLSATLDLPQSYKLLRIEPSEYTRNGTTIKLGDLLPKEEKAAAWVLEPLICGKEKIGGSFSGVDANGTPFATPMNPIEVEVRCPMFVRPEEANLPMVQRLIGDLPVHSERSFYLPETLAPGDAFEVAKKVIAERDVRLVGTFSGEAGQPYDQSAWFYGVTKVKQKRFVIIATVSEADRTIRIASTCDEEDACTGFLAETGASVRRELVTRGAVDSEEGVIELVCEKCGATLPRAPLNGRDVACPECRSQWRVSDFFR